MQEAGDKYGAAKNNGKPIFVGSHEDVAIQQEALRVALSDGHKK